jgi:DNA invertase Pin-like site-specific DNA recombinase
MLTLLAAIAEFERGLLRQRQREGVAKAKADKKYKGRKPTARARAAEVLNGVRQASRRINLHDGKARPCFCRPVAHAIPP